ncbi:hypothetical protein SEA_EMOTION_66 [Arthrobacter phage Emotion]|uniref:Uncharacterized protein n=1 Tax=Arthrobacter phage Emotion TaxID=3038361 RepID=A0AA49IJZ2_9CAUD|nr:hypothetical protein SEA_EMOTION_66 [Arthrobacter phage Emotion]
MHYFPNHVVTVVEAEIAAIKSTLARPEGEDVSRMARQRAASMLTRGEIESHEYPSAVIGQARDLLIEDRRKGGPAWCVFRQEWRVRVLQA